MSSYTSGSISVVGELAGIAIIGTAGLIIGGTAYGGYKLVESAVKGTSAISEALVSTIGNIFAKDAMATAELRQYEQTQQRNFNLFRTTAGVHEQKIDETIRELKSRGATARELERLEKLKREAGQLAHKNLKGSGQALGLEVQQYLYELKQLQDNVDSAVSAIRNAEENQQLAEASAESMQRLASSMEAARVSIQYTLDDKDIEFLGLGQEYHKEESGVQTSPGRNSAGRKSAGGSQTAENTEETKKHLEELRSYLRPLAESALISERSRVSRMGLEEGDRLKLEAFFRKIDSCMTPGSVRSEEEFRIHMLTQLLREYQTVWRPYLDDKEREYMEVYKSYRYKCEYIGIAPKSSGEFSSIKQLKAVSEHYSRYVVYAAEIRRLGMDGYVRMAMDNVMKELGYSVYGGVIVGTNEEGMPDGVTSRDYSLTDNGILRVTQYHDGQIQGEMFFTGNAGSETEKRAYAGTQKSACAKRAEIRRRLYEEYGLVLDTAEKTGPEEVMPKSIEEIDEDHNASDIQNANEMALNEARKAGQTPSQVPKEQAMP